MSDFLAEARVVVTPDTTKFRAQLLVQLAAATKGLVVPVNTLATAQGKAAASAAQLAGAQSEIAANAKKSTSALLGAGTASAKLDASLLGLRTALGSTAVIGLGAVALAAIVAGKALRALVTNAAAFEQELNTFQATTGATAEQMVAVSDAAKRLGEDVRLPAVSAADAAVAFTELAKAGLSIEDALAGAEGVLQLATAAQISNADAAEIAANSLNSFGLAGKEATRVADGLANAANASQGSILDMGIAMRQVSAVARQVGLSLEDTEATLALFAKNGLAGSDAGTSLRVALIRLVAPTAKAAAEIKNLGLRVRDAQGNLRADIFAQFGEATRDLTPAVRDAAAALIFGQDAIRAVSIGAREGAEGLKLMQFEIDRTGTASELASARTQGLAGSFSALQSNAQTFGIAIGGIVTGPLKQITDSLSTTFALATNLVEQFAKLGKVKIPAIHIPLIVDVTGPDGQGGGTDVKDIVGKILDFSLFGSKGPFGQIAKSADNFNKSIEKVTTPKNILKARDQLKALQEQLQALQDARISSADAGNFFAADALTPKIEKLKKDIASLNQEIKGVDVSPLGKIREAINDLNALPPGTPGAKKALDSLLAQIDSLKAGGSGATAPLTIGLDKVTPAAERAAAALARANAQIKVMAAESTRLGDQLQKLQAEGAGPAAQIAVLQQDVQSQNAIIAAAEKGGRTAGDITTIRKARDKIIAHNAEIASLQTEIATVAKDAATEAEKKRDELDAALQKQFDAATTPIGRLLDRASFTESFKDDIKFTTQLIVLYKHQIAEATNRIKDADTRNAVLKALGDKLFAALMSRKKLAQDERKRIHDALVDKIDRIQTGIQLDIELADINENTKRRISLREKLIQQLKNERKKLHLTGNALKENRNEIARINAEIEEIRKEEKKTGNQFAQLSFEFLQRQQGFAANLLGNLIPGGATGGLVGGTSPASQGAVNVPGLGVTQESHIAQAKDTGFSAGQGNTTNSLLREIRDNLKILNGHSSHPEARNQRVMNSGAAHYLVS